MTATAQYRVYYEDTDAGGVVYHANFLKFAERARTDALRGAGHGQRSLREEYGILFVVRRCALDIRRPGRLDDLLTVTSEWKDFSGARFYMTQYIHCGEELLCTAEIELVTVGEDFRPALLPSELIGALKRAFPQEHGRLLD